MELNGPEKTALVEAELIELERMKVVELLRENRSQFAQTLVDMLGLDPSVATYRLNIDPHSKKVLQKKRNIFPQKAIAEEVEKLKPFGSIKEVQFPTWLSNIIQLKKQMRNGECL